MNENTPRNDASTDSDNELRSVVSALDESVPRDGSWIQLTQYGGGPDEGKITGNRNGYRRLGIEFLRATLDDDPEQGFGVDLEYLVSPDSTINFDCFELSDVPTPNRVSPPLVRLRDADWMLDGVCGRSDHLRNRRWCRGPMDRQIRNRCTRIRGL